MPVDQKKAHRQKAAIILGKQLKQARLNSGMSQRSLAELVDVKDSYISQIENGLRIPSIGLCRSIGSILGAWGLDSEELINKTMILRDFENRHLYQAQPNNLNGACLEKIKVPAFRSLIEQIFHLLEEGVLTLEEVETLTQGWLATMRAARSISLGAREKEKSKAGSTEKSKKDRKDTPLSRVNGVEAFEANT